MGKHQTKTFPKYESIEHKCTYKDCLALFKQKDVNTSAHALTYLHMRKMHNATINLACHRNCMNLDLE